MKKLFIILPLFTLCVLLLTGCSDADIASQRLSTEADYFKIVRRIVFYNGITGDYMLSIEGRCSLGNDRTETEISITCKTGEDEYKKHFLGLSDNVTYFVEQLDGKNMDVNHYKVVFKPSIIIPDIEFK
jgi:hypothetical protein